MAKKLRVGDEAITMPWIFTDAGIGGSKVRVGEEIAVHKSDMVIADYLSHGRSRVKVGDDVIIRPSVEFPLVALKPVGCGLEWYKNSHGVDNYDNSRQYFHYVYKFDEPMMIGGGTKFDIRIIMNRVEYGEGFQNWYPYGGIWIGAISVGEDADEDTVDFWIDANPYDVVSGPPNVACEEGVFEYELTVDFNKIIPDETYWAHYLVFHVRVCSTLFWSNRTRSEIGKVICLG